MLVFSVPCIVVLEMRRRTQKQFKFANFGFFLAALFLILYLNLQPSTSKSFDWRTIRYKTTARSLPEERGICPGLSKSEKPALVVARIAGEDSRWLDDLADLYHLCIYTADAPVDISSSNLQVPANRGHEAMAYLTFLIDNYAYLPEAGAVFVHGSRFAWHNDARDYDNKALLAKLNVSSALQSTGYHNLRCDWSASTCNPSSSEPQGSLATNTRAMIEPYNIRAVSDAALPRALASLFGQRGADVAKAKLGRNDAVRSQCCAQFVVGRENIYQHSRDEYVALRQWLLDGNSEAGSQKGPRNSNAAPLDDRIAGRVLSYVWHILFIRHDEAGSDISLDYLNKLACPSAEECYCRLYGKCDLSSCTPGYCPRQYRLPPDYKLPDDWASTHS